MKTNQEINTNPNSKPKRQKSLILSSILLVLTVGLLPCKGRAGDTFKLKSAGFMHAQGPQGQEVIIPLKKTKADLEIMGSVMEVQVLQEFKNKNKFPLEAVYVFPLPSNATVTNYRIIYQDKLVRSVVKERNEAKATYEQAKAAGKRTALLEEERPNIFTTSVANILPGEKIEVEVTFLAPLHYHDGTYEVLFPTVVGPRYIPVTHLADPDAHRITPPLVPEGMDPQYELEVSAKVSGIPFDDISSPTHAIKVKEEDLDKALVKLKKKAVPNSDFVLKIHVDQKEQPALALVQHQEASRTYGLLNIFPPLPKKNATPLSREILFLVDTSGSMDGASILQAREGLKQCLGGLRPQDFFNIVRFSDDYSAMSSQSLPATQENIGRAHYYVEGLQASGGTQMQPALDYVLSQAAQPHAMRMVVFLTDGDVGNEVSLIQLLKNKLGGARLFAFGIGSAPNEYLLRRMGEEGHGVTHFIHDQQEIAGVISSFFSSIDSPVLTDVQVEWVNARGRPLRDVVSFPKNLPDVYQQRPLSLTFRGSAMTSGVIRVKGKVGENLVEYSFAIPQARQQHAGIKSLFGRAEVDSLLYNYQFNTYTEDLRKSLQEKITQVALDYQLVTPFTSRVAVEEKIVRREGDRLVTTQVPSLLPQGWTYRGLVGTATQDTLYLLIGALLLLSSLVLWNLYRRKNTFAFSSHKQRNLS